MILAGAQNRKVGGDTNVEILEMKGELSEEEARDVMLKYFRANIGIATKVLLGITLEPIQILSLRAMFKRNFVMQVRSRGGAKSFEAGIYCILKSIFFPGTRIVIASANFRTSRRLLIEYVDKLLNKPGAELARQCFGKFEKRQDSFHMDVWGGGYISAIPLTEETRGMRCDVLVLDEALLLSQKMIDEVLAPFLSSPPDAEQRIEAKQREDDLVRSGVMTDEERTVFPNMSQMLLLSSASYQFEHLYRIYEIWCDFIDHPEKIDLEEDDDGNLIRKEDEKGFLEERSTYCIIQLGWECIPGTILNRKFISSQKAILSEDSFGREYCAQFRDGGSSYFSPLLMKQATIEDGLDPCVLLKGRPDKKYILSIDPNDSKSRSADYFAMGLFELGDEKEENLIQVHGYQMVASNYENHIDYINYLFQCFNIVLIIGDSSGLETLIDNINSNTKFQQKHKKKLSFIEAWDSDIEEEDKKTAMLIEAKKQYNVEIGCMVIKQYETSKFKMKANTWLQACIQHKKVTFASHAAPRNDILQKMFETDIPTDLIKVRALSEKLSDKEEMRKLEIRELIDLQDFIVDDTKRQCAAVERRASGMTIQFDLPAAARKSTDPNKPRKDNYSCLVYGNWGAKCYFQLQTQPEEVMPEGFVSTFSLFS